jgi:putative MATE family efflux protein
MEQQTSIQKMGTIPVPRLMLSMGVPIILSMVLQAFYNIVDSAFVSNMEANGEAALNALTLAFPIQVLMIALGIGTGVGVNALLSKSLGMGNTKKAAHICGNAIFLGIVIYALFLLFGLFGVRFYIGTQTKDSLIFSMAVGYLQICCLLSMGNVCFALFEKILQSTGLSLYSTIAMMSGAVLNIILDPILIYGLFGLPKLGVNGAAYATVIGQIASALLALTFHFKFNKAIENKAENIKPDGTIIKEIYRIGLPAILAQAVMSLMTYGLNIILVRVDASLVTAYGLFYKIQQFVLFAAFGLRDTITPILSFNHGMQHKRRLQEGIRYGITYTLIIMAVGTVLIETFALPLSGVFGLSGTTQALCVSAMRIISASFLFAGLNIAFQGIFQALDGGVDSLIISVLRQLVFVLPVAWGFSIPAIKSMDYAWTIWLTFPIAEVLSALVACAFMVKIYRREVKPLKDVVPAMKAAKLTLVDEA